MGAEAADREQDDRPAATAVLVGLSLKLEFEVASFKERDSVFGARQSSGNLPRLSSNPPSRHSFISLSCGQALGLPLAIKITKCGHYAAWLLLR